MMSEINVGDKVLLRLGVDFENAPPGLKRWDGCTFLVSRKRWLRNANIYELKACNSPSGIPYSIFEEWITLTR